MSVHCAPALGQVRGGWEGGRETGHWRGGLDGQGGQDTLVWSGNTAAWWDGGASLLENGPGWKDCSYSWDPFTIAGGT